MRILVAGAKPNVGKTTATITIAKEYASHRKRVLCIDTDIFNPSLTEQFGLKGKPGLSQCLRGAASWRDVLLSTDWFDVIGAGERVRIPGELFRTEKFENILHTIEYDLVLIDTPPYGMFRMVYLYENLCDGVLLVGEGEPKFTSPIIGRVGGKIENIDLTVETGYNAIKKFENMEV